MLLVGAEGVEPSFRPNLIMQLSASLSIRFTSDLSACPYRAPCIPAVPRLAVFPASHPVFPGCHTRFQYCPSFRAAIPDFNIARLSGLPYQISILPVFPGCHTRFQYCPSFRAAIPDFNIARLSGLPFRGFNRQGSCTWVVFSPVPWPGSLLHLFKMIYLPSSRLFSIFGAVFIVKDGAKISNLRITTKYFGYYFRIMSKIISQYG